MGRPPIEINWEEFDKLCAMQATLEEIAGWYLCSIDTIERRIKEKYGETFTEYYKKASQGGKISLRRYQWKNAKSGNTTMQVWLGKQYLGQKDKQEVTHEGKVDSVVEFYLPNNERDKKGN